MSHPSPPALPRLSTDAELRGRFRGCLLGGAVGDALGAAVEFLTEEQIHAQFGRGGIRDFAPAYGRIGAITDDTQMTLFTADGMLRAHVRAGGGRQPLQVAEVMSAAYQRWLKAIGLPHRTDAHERGAGWLMQHADLHHHRSPGRTCVPSLMAQQSAGEAARNESKGCGGVMRIAPVGMYFAAMRGEAAPQAAFDRGIEVAALTHGHPSGQLPAGFLAALVASLLGGAALDNAAESAARRLRHRPHHEETLAHVEQARELARRRPRDAGALRELGAGWSAHEALAIGLYCALGAIDFESAIVLAVNHGGDSDSTGSITGNILGACWGAAAIPPRWLEPLELRDAIGAIADDLATVAQWSFDDPREREFYADRYPGH